MYICKKDKKIITTKDLEEVQADAVKSIFGDIEFRFLEDTFPFTDPSIQIEINWNGQWMEITGAGLVHKQVLRNLNIDPEIYNGFAFGLGLDRLVMMKYGIDDIRHLQSGDLRFNSQFKLF